MAVSRSRLDTGPCVWVRLAWLLVAAVALWIGRDFVDQERVDIVGKCDPLWSGDIPSLLIYDYRYNETACVPLPAKRPLKFGVNHGE